MPRDREEDEKSSPVFTLVRRMKSKFEATYDWRRAWQSFRISSVNACVPFCAHANEGRVSLLSLCRTDGSDGQN